MDRRKEPALRCMGYTTYTLAQWSIKMRPLWNQIPECCRVGGPQINCHAGNSQDSIKRVTGSILTAFTKNIVDPQRRGCDTTITQLKAAGHHLLLNLVVQYTLVGRSGVGFSSYRMLISHVMQPKPIRCCAYICKRAKCQKVSSSCW